MGIIVDASICAIFLIVLIVGLLKGFVKQLSRFLRFIASLIGAILLTAIILQAIHNVGFFQSFEGITTGWFSGDAMIQEIHSSEELAQALSEHKVLKIIASQSEALYNDMLTISTEAVPCNTLGAFLGHHVANLIAGFVLWILLLFILRLIFKGLIGLMKDIIVMPAFRTLDRIFGVLWAVGLTYAILIGIVLGGVEAAILKFAPNVWGKIADYIQGTTVLRWLHDTNFIGELLAGLMNVSIPSI